MRTIDERRPLPPPFPDLDLFDEIAPLLDHVRLMQRFFGHSIDGRDQIPITVKAAT